MRQLPRSLAAAVIGLLGCGLPTSGVPGDAASSSVASGASGSTGGGGSPTTASTGAATTGAAGGGSAGGASGGGAAAATSSGGGAGGSGGSVGAAGSGGEGGSAACDGEGVVFSGGPSQHCYLHVNVGTHDWLAARGACMAWGGDLAALSSQAEYEYVLENVTPQEDDAWIGGHRAANPLEFYWSNGEAWGELGWAAILGMPPWKSAGEPDPTEDCVKIHDGFEGKPCDDTPPKGYVCER